MNTIEQMLTAQMEMKEFIALLKTDKSLQNSISNLVPKEATNCPEHVFWQGISYDSLKNNAFDYLQFLLWMCRLDGSIGDNLNIFDAIYYAYSYYYTGLNVTSRYEDAFDLYLDVIRDCFDGPEVGHLVEEIINDFIQVRPKSRRKKEAKEKVNTLFHVSGRTYPRWIQGPEWPMGTFSPMEFVSRKNVPDGVSYFFKDVDTGDARTIVQYY